MLVSTWQHHWFSRTYRLNKYLRFTPTHKYISYSSMSFFTSLKTMCHESTVTASPNDLASLVTSFYFSHFFFFCEIIQKWTNTTTLLPFYLLQKSECVCSCHFTSSCLPLTCHTSCWEGDKSSKIFHETGFNANCLLSLRESGPRWNTKCALQEDAWFNASSAFC